MYKTIQTFFKRGRKPAQKAAKGLLRMALFAVIITSSVFPMGSLTSTVTSAPMTAHAADCAVATAVSNSVSNATPSVGDTVTFTLIGAPASTASVPVTINDLLPSGLTFASSSASTGTYNSATGVWDLSALIGTPGEIKLTIIATINTGTEGQKIVNTATVNYKSGCVESSAVNTSTLTVKGSVTPTSTPANADLSIAKTVDNTKPFEGDTVHYTVSVKDLGPATSTGVVASDTLPSGLTFVLATSSVGNYSTTTGLWTIGDLATSSVATLDVFATVNSSTANTSITNWATVSESASSTDLYPANNIASSTIAVQATSTPITPTSIINNADLSIVKTVDNTTPSEGDIVHYTIKVGDLGPSTSTGVVASDTLPSGLTFVSATSSVGNFATSTNAWTIGNLNASSTVTLTIAAKVNAGTASTTITNTATVSESASSTDSNLSNNSSSVSIAVQPNPVVPAKADIAITKSVDTTSTNEGATVHYTIKVNDLGPATSTGVVASDTLPSTLKFISSNASTGTYASSTGMWTIGTLATSSTATLTITASVNSGTAGTIITNTSTVSESASINDTNMTNNTASASFAVKLSGTCSVAGAFADSVDKTNPKVGDLITYTLIGAPALTASTHMIVTDMLDSSLTFVSSTASVGTYTSSTGIWDLGTLNGATSTTLTITARVNAGTEGETIDNTPSVEYAQSSCTQSSAITGASITVQAAPVTPSADLSVVKTVDNTTPSEGNTVNYTIAVNDLGPATSTGVVASDTLPSGLTFENATASVGSYATSTGIWTIGDLGMHNATATLAIAAKVNAGTAGTTITNTATVSESASSTDSDLSNNSSSVSIAVQGGGGGCGSSCPVPSADISIKKIVDNPTPSEGDTVSYTIAVKDLGPAISTGVVASDTLPLGLTFDSATASVGTYSTSTSLWTIGDLGMHDATATLTIAAKVNAGTENTSITNWATVSESASSTDSNLANNIASSTIAVQGNGGCGSSCPEADIAVVKTVDNANPNPGDTVNYTVTVTDNGPATSTNVMVHDQLPPTTALSLLSATTSQGSPYGTTGDWTVGTVGPNATATLKMAVVVGSNQAGNTITNTATVTQLSSIIDPHPDNNSSTVVINVQNPIAPNADLQIVKTVDNANPNPGDTVNYTVTVTDLGPATSTGVVATDTLPTGVTFVSATSSVGSYATSTGVWTIGDLATSSIATLTIAATVDAGTAGTSITNWATVGESASSTDLYPANNIASSTIAVPGGGGGCTSNCGGGGGGTPTAEIGIVKTVDNANPMAGATIHYTLTVSATGPSPSEAVVASDTLPSGVTLVSASSSLGTYNSATGVWTIGNMNDGQSAVLAITATVNASDVVGQVITNTGTVTESRAVNDQNSGNNTSSVTVTVAGGGGGGGGTVSVPSGGGGGVVLSASTSTGQVLGASTCGLYLSQYIHPTRKFMNDPAQVKKLQLFLNQEVGTTLPITGYYGPLTIAAVNQFQVKYHTEDLLPWIPLGLPTEFTPTNYVYQTTWRWINLIMCPSLNLPEPTLQVDNFSTSYTYAL